MNMKKEVGSVDFVIFKWIKNFFNELFKEPKLPNQEENWKEAERLAKEFDAEVADLKVQLAYLVSLIYKLEEKEREKGEIE